MQQVFTIGETVLDIIFKNFQPTASKAGGSMLNATISLGRLGIPVKFISEFGNDDFGKYINDFLADNNVNTQLCNKFTDGKTSISIANLDNSNNASYTFYKELPKNRIKIDYQNINAGDIILFGSFFAINSDVRTQIIDFIKFAKSRGAIVIYDPNYRKAHLHELDKLFPMIIENIKLADIVRCSDDDCKMIFNSDNFDESYEKIKNYCPNFIYTISSKSVIIQTNNFKKEYFVKVIETISTIGAGDNFNAGLVYGIFNNKLKLNDLNNLPEIEYSEIINYAVSFAQNVCQSYDNYISKEFAESVKIKNKLSHIC